ncbi:hypothetical protein AAHH67_09970 [Niallia circulans]
MEDFSLDEWEQERERLEYTKNYMNIVLHEAQINQGTLQENVRESISNEEALDSSLSYINYLTNSKFLQLATTELSILKRILDTPILRGLIIK